MSHTCRHISEAAHSKWEEIKGFDIGRSGLLPMVCRIHMRDGMMMHAFGIQETNLRTGAAKRLVDALNRELAERQASGGAEFSIT